MVRIISKQFKIFDSVIILNTIGQAMYIKFLLMIFFLSVGVVSYAANPMAKMATQEQLDRLCIPLVLAVDNDIHWYYYKHVRANEDAITIMYGKGLVNSYDIPKHEILNWDEAVSKHERLSILSP